MSLARPLRALASLMSTWRPASGACARARRGGPTAARVGLTTLVLTGCFVDQVGEATGSSVTADGSGTTSDGSTASDDSVDAASATSSASEGTSTGTTSDTGTTGGTTGGTTSGTTGGTTSEPTTSTSEPTTSTTTDPSTTSMTTDPTSTSEPTTGQTTDPVAVCGNGVIEPGEVCDDGNLDDGDGCLSDCTTASCSDFIKNQGESDVDCGGPCPTKCPPCGTCSVNNECAKGLSCEAGRCNATFDVNVDWAANCGAKSEWVPVPLQYASTYRITATGGGGYAWKTNPQVYGWVVHCDGFNLNGLSTEFVYASPKDAFNAVPGDKSLVQNFAGGDALCAIVDDPCTDNLGVSSITIRHECG